MPISLNSLLSVARSAMMSQQAALQVVSDNIANASTDGYTRKRAEIVSGPSQLLPEGMVGSGIMVKNVSQVRDRFLDASHRDNISSQSHHQVRYDYLAQVEAALAEPGERGLNATLDAFWSAWGDLANDPLNSTARTVVRERGAQLASHFRMITDSLDRLRDATAQRLQSALDDVNALGTQIADLNQQIVAAESTGATAGHLRDARDLALDKLAAFAPIQVLERANGSVAVAIDGVNIVDGMDRSPLHASFGTGNWRIVTQRNAEAVPTGGMIGGYLSLLNTDLPQLQRDLDRIAVATVDAVNGVHQQGTNPFGNTGVLFFNDTAPVTARTIRLSDTIANDAQAIAAGRGVDASGAPLYRAGVSDIARELAALRLSDNAQLGMSIGRRYEGMVGQLAAAVRAAQTAGEAQGVLVQQSASVRDSIMGVSTDEELVELIRLQNAYAAAARIVSTADELMRTVLEMKR